MCSKAVDVRKRTDRYGRVKGERTIESMALASTDTYVQTGGEKLQGIPSPHLTLRRPRKKVSLFLIPNCRQIVSNRM